MIVQLHSHGKEEKEVGSNSRFAAREVDAAAASARNLLGGLERGFFRCKKLEESCSQKRACDTDS
jgi:hypothetical protein